ncbi:unnamed protein product, partial [Prorocentrum cordatum]
AAAVGFGRHLLFGVAPIFVRAHFGRPNSREPSTPRLDFRIPGQSAQRGGSAERGIGASLVSPEEGFRSLRTAELKHGRAAMMAALGFAAQQHVKFPGFESVPEGVGAVATAPGTYGFAALFLFAGAMELAAWTQDPKKEAGNFGDPLGLSNLFGYDEDMRNTGLNNGRFAMFAAIGILSAELLTSKVGMNQF